MTSNEKRAHDLAIATLPIIYEGYKNNISNNISSNDGPNKQFIFDIYSEYINAYNASLKSFNRDFPVED